MGAVHVVALSGGADSSAMALRLRELERQERGDAPTRYTFVCTPTGNELPDMAEHWAHLGALLGAEIVRLPGHTLEGLMERMHVLPTTRMRWCTRMLKVEPIIAWYARLPAGSVAYVGLRADEETREGIYGSAVRQAFPLREWGWNRADVEAYLRVRGVKVPGRTDCAWCPYQGADDWYRLWRDHPDPDACPVCWHRRGAERMRDRFQADEAEAEGREDAQTYLDDLRDDETGNLRPPTLDDLQGVDPDWAGIAVDQCGVNWWVERVFPRLDAAALDRRQVDALWNNLRAQWCDAYNRGAAERIAEERAELEPEACDACRDVGRIQAGCGCSG